MKRFVSFLMILVLSLSLTACSKSKPADTGSDSNTTVTTATPAPTAAPEPTSAPALEPTETPTPEPTAAPTPEPTEVPVPNELTLEVITTEAEREDFTAAGLNVSYDSINVVNPGYEALKETLNSICSGYEVSALDFAEYCLPDLAELPEDQYCFLEYSIGICRADDEVVSFCYAISSYLGGIHPFYYVESYNIDTQTGKIIDIVDLFGGTVYSQEWNAFETALQYELANHEAADMFFSEYKDTLNTILSEENVNSQLIWFYEEDKIVVEFDQYVLAPYAAGPIEVEIPFRNGAINYPEKSADELLSELSREWNIFYSEVDGWGEVYGLDSESLIWDTRDIATFTINSNGTATLIQEGSTVFENAAITFGSWQDTYYAAPGSSTFDIDYNDGENYYYGTYDGENVYLTHEIDVPDYHVAVYMVFVADEPTYHEAYASIVQTRDSDTIIALKDYVTLLSWDDPDYLATFGVTAEDFLDDTLRYTYPRPAHQITIDSWNPPILRNMNYETVEAYDASYEEFIENLSDKWYWNDYLGVPVIYVNGRYGPVYIAEEYTE